jgi:hypothetical protein
MKLLFDYERGLAGYTYLSLNGANSTSNSTPPNA